MIYSQLFDFDTEVQPILEVLVGKTIEQALMEVIEDEEIAIIKHQQRMFLEVRAGEKAELERLVEEERRIREEKVIIFINTINLWRKYILQSNLITYRYHREKYHIHE